MCIRDSKKSLAKLSRTERRKAVELVGDVVRAAMFDDAAGDDYEIELCPRCGSTAVVKKGKSKNGDRRYLDVYKRQVLLIVAICATIWLYRCREQRRADGKTNVGWIVFLAIAYPLSVSYLDVYKRQVLPRRPP